MSTHCTFPGFGTPTKNFFSMPNEIINLIAHITNLAELKVIIYVIRHTWGFHEYGIHKTISTDEFMHGRRKQDGTRMDEGTGLSNRSVIDGLRAAVDHGYLICEIDTSDKARTVKSYALKMIDAPMKNLHREDDTPYEESSQDPMKILHTPYEDVSHQREESSHRSEKDTIERHYRKTLEKQEGTESDLPSQDRALTLSQEEIELILSLRAHNAHPLSDTPLQSGAFPHQGSEQTQPTPVAPAQHTSPLPATVPGSGDSTPRSSGELPALPVSSNSATRDAALPSAQQSEPTTGTSSKTASQRDSEPSSTTSSEASELHIADTTPSTTQSAAQPTMKDRVEAVYKCYEQLCREKFEDESITIKRKGNRTEEYKAIKDALESKGGVTSTSLRQVFLDMWSEKGREGDYFYRDLTHITIRAVCNQHGKRLANIRFRERKPNNKSVSGLPNLTYGQTPPSVLSPSSLPFDAEPYTSLHPSGEDTDEMKPARKFKLRRSADIEAEIAARQAAHA